ncbi:MAG: aminodeoxychorismate lyase [Gammaproteobacteria bacterium]|nr:MAG: aminodeoxychorismate lyase [Gammaproteobacteria bacterium]
MILVNGHETTMLSTEDRGLLYGDGVFETMVVQDGCILCLDRHLQRLCRGCERLRMPAPSMEAIREEVTQVAQKKGLGIVKLLCTRGGGNRGYAPPQHTSGTRVVGSYSWPESVDPWAIHGLRMMTCSTRLGINPDLAGIKHMNRLEQVLGAAEVTAAEVDEGLMLDGEQRVVEGTMSNLFAVMNGALVTPRLSRCGVAGIVREIIIERATQFIDTEVQVADIDRIDLDDADEIFMTNSVIGVCPVTTLDEQERSIGSLSRSLMSALQTNGFVAKR